MPQEQFSHRPHCVWSDYTQSSRYSAYNYRRLCFHSETRAPSLLWDARSNGRQGHSRFRTRAWSERVSQQSDRNAWNPKRDWSLARIQKYYRWHEQLGKGTKRDCGKTWHSELANKTAAVKDHIYWSIDKCAGNPLKKTSPVFEYLYFKFSKNS